VRRGLENEMGVELSGPRSFSNGRFRQHQKFNGFAGFGNSAYACWEILCISMKLKTA